MIEKLFFLRLLVPHLLDFLKTRIILKVEIHYNLFGWKVQYIIFTGEKLCLRLSSFTSLLTYKRFMNMWNYPTTSNRCFD